MGLGNLEVVPNSEPETIDDASQHVGQLLKSAREGLKLSIPDVSAEIRIRSLYLEYLESGNFKGLPGQVYLVGFIKTYATFLGLDYKELLRQLNLQKDVIYDYSSFTYVVPARAQQTPSRKLSFLTANLAILLLGSVYYLGQEPEKDIAPVIEEARSLIEESPLSVTTDPVAVEPPSQPVQVTSEPTTLQTNITPSDGKELPKAMGSEQLQIKAIKDSWVQVLNKEGKTIYVRLMHAGDTYALPQADCILNTGNAGGVKLVVGEQETGVLGEAGKVIRGLVLNHDTVQALIRPNTNQGQ